ncbi:MAG: hypothetical protein PHQ66_01205 [Candidatus Nanoarchaeia archaeon]|nr:hypothetical protein [Candidatus Nanoarchaeia archaeon]MDD5358004.1 hypothetical protein [Candidatus Nanoarchaeia archaeon]MDD5588923.1 hypothetical protein [Candidatus Nanoarchaeia archaeon]
MKGKTKKEDTKRRFAQEFAILLILVVSVGILFFYSSVNFTGYATFSEYANQSSCQTAGYTWEDLTVQNCTTVATCVNQTNNCEPCINSQNVNGTQVCLNWTQCTNQTCTNNEVCVPVVTGGQCTGNCDSSHLNLCSNETACNSAMGAGNYWYANACHSTQCTPKTCGSLGYNCEIWSDGCGGTVDCGTCADGAVCSSGVCPTTTGGTTEETSEESSEEESSESSEEGSSGSQITVAAIRKKTCVPDWECGEWQECINNQQIRVCTDVNKCGFEDGIPTTSQACTSETCSDKIKNQDETGVDCGGSTCKKCGGFFTIVGSSISGAINASTDFVLKGMFGSLPKAIISIFVLAFIIGGIIVARLFVLKKKVKIDFRLMLSKFGNLKNIFNKFKSSN